MSPVTMVDGATGDVDAIYERFGAFVPVAGYVTGPGIEWSDTQFAMFRRKVRIAQSASPYLDDLSIARVLDVETGAAGPEDWPEFYLTRSAGRATCYCSLETVPGVARACDLAGIPLPSRWWLAWYWQFPGYPTQARVLAELRKLTGVELPPDTLWAVQYVNYPHWDQSVVYGTPDFAR